MKRLLIALLFAATASGAHAEAGPTKKPDPKTENVQLNTENKSLKNQVTYLSALAQALKLQRDEYLDQAALRAADVIAAQAGAK